MGNVAVVTGGSSGIGREVARRLAARGVGLVLVARGEKRLREVGEELGAEWETCDVGDREAVERLAARIAERHPSLWLLVNNAGIPGRTSFLDGEPERIEEVLRVNYLGALWCTRAFLPALETGRPSHVVNVVSVAGTVTSAAGGPYTAAKHAEMALSRTLAIELAPRGVSVHTVNPGFVETEGFPQEVLVRRRFVGRLVAGPELVADRVLKAIDRDRREVFVPRWYRIPAVAQALAPGTLARVLGRRRSRRSRV